MTAPVLTDAQRKALEVLARHPFKTARGLGRAAIPSLGFTGGVHDVGLTIGRALVKAGLACDATELAHGWPAFAITDKGHAALAAERGDRT